MDLQIKPQVRSGAELRALRECMGLSVEDFARVTCGSKDQVIGWEGLSERIPNKVWRLVDEAVDLFESLVDDLADVKAADERFGGKGRPVPLEYFRSQRNYAEFCEVRGLEPFEGCDFGVDGVAPFGFRNAAVREAARRLREAGRTVVIGYVSDEEPATVLNRYGVEVDYQAAVSRMDKKLRQEVEKRLGPCTAQELFEQYCAVHLDVFGEDFSPSNPFAVFSTDDGSLNFYNRNVVPKEGDVFEGKSVSKLFLLDELWADVDFSDVACDAVSVMVVDDGIKPQFLNGWFSGFRKLESADLSRFDVSECLDMGSLFKGCVRLKQVNLSGLNTAHVANMTRMFAGCERLESLDLSGFDTSSVWGMARLLEGCRSLKAVNLSGFDTRNVEAMTCMFAGCCSLEEIDLSGFCTLIAAKDASLWHRLKDVSGMFDGCKSLQRIKAPLGDWADELRQAFPALEGKLA